MAFDARVLKVMIASPSDVAQERQAARAVLNSWNDIHAEERRLILQAIG